MQQINPLLVILSPRDLENVIKHLKDNFIMYDKIWVKYYYPIQHACKAVNDFIFSHPEYTHIIIYVDDVIAEPHHVNTLLNAVRRYRFPVLMGYSNFDNETMSHLTTISLKPVQIKIEGRTWPVISFDEVKQIKKRFLRVKWNGLTLPVISTKVLKIINGLEDDSRLNNRPYATCGNSDVALCHKLNEKNIPIYTDLSVRVIHLRSRENWKYFYGGKKPSYTLFEPKKV